MNGTSWSAGVDIREAVPADLAVISAFLEAAGLPPEGLGEAGTVLVAARAGHLVGSIALERYEARSAPPAYLLRSAVVLPDERGRGIGSALTRAALAIVDSSAATVALLTETAAGYFPRFGFVAVAREALPAALSASPQLRGACPIGATAMLRPTPSKERNDTMKDTELREEVRAHYAEVAKATTAAHPSRSLDVLDHGCCVPAGSTTPAQSCCSGTADTDAAFGGSLYSAGEQAELPVAAVAASLGCGNPLMVAELNEGERVLDLGSGGGIDVLLSAKRVGATGFAYGIDMTEEMLTLARRNAAEAGVGNVEFIRGKIEELPLPDGSVDVVISNCVINLSTDKAAVFREMYRVLAVGGRVGVSDVVAEDQVTPAEREERGSFAGCIAGALSRAEYIHGLAAVGFDGVEVNFTHEVAQGMHGAIIRATKPAQSEAQ